MINSRNLIYTNILDLTELWFHYQSKKTSSASKVRTFF